MDQSKLLGERIRKRRKQAGLTQKQFAELLAISPSYLNMIESGQRQVAGKLLSRIARQLGDSVADLNAQPGGGNIMLLKEILADQRDLDQQSLYDRAAETLVPICEEFPEWVRLIAQLYNQSKAVEQFKGQLQQRTRFERQLGDIGHQVLQHLTTMRSASAILQNPAGLSVQERERFGGIVQRESQSLETLSRQFFDQLNSLQQQSDAFQVRRDIDQYLQSHANYFPWLEAMSETCRRAMGQTEALRQFSKVRAWIGQHCRADIEARCQAESQGHTAAFESQLYHYFEHYLAAATIAPYQRFLDQAVECAYDIDHLSVQFALSWEQIGHRLTTLRREDSNAIAFAFMKIDAAGNVIKSLSLPEFFVPTSGAMCPRWPIFSSAQVVSETIASRLLHDQGQEFLALARSRTQPAQRFNNPARSQSMMLVCHWQQAHNTVYFATADQRAVTVGSSCSNCRYPNCPDRLRSSVLA